MVRWRMCLALAMLLLLPARSRSKLEDDDDDERNEEDDEEDENDDEEEEESEPVEKPDTGPGRRAPSNVLPVNLPKPQPVTRTTPRRSLECYVCAYKADAQLKACLDPTKYRVHTITCHNVDDKCFTSVVTKNNIYEAVIRGCRSGCLGTSETTCCELNRCNNQALAQPIIAPSALKENKATKSIPPTVFFFVTILLILQTVAKVAFV